MQSRYILRRTGQMIVTFFATVTLTFALYQAMPGGPAQAMRNMLLSQSPDSVGTFDPGELSIAVERHANLDPSDPIPVQFIDYLSAVVFEQDLGRSIFLQREVGPLILERLPWSVFIGVYALAIGYTITLLVGTLMAYKEGSTFDSITSSGLIIANSIPYYIIGIVLIFILAVENSYFPSQGKYATGIEPGFTLEFMVSLVRHATLPAISAGALTTGGALAMRANAIRTLGDDYVRVAELRGLRRGRIALQYVGRNSVLPIYTGMVIGIAGVVSSTVVLERIFGYFGMGLLMLNATRSQDYPLLMAGLIVLTTVTLIAIYVADLTYGYIDPRITTGESNE